MNEYITNTIIEKYESGKLDNNHFTEIMNKVLDGETYTEAYYGKSDILMKAEEILGKMLKLMRDNPLDDYTNHPLNKQFQKVLQKQFGFKKLFVLWYRSTEYAPNASTFLSVDLTFNDPDMYVIVDKKKGYYDINHKHVCLISVSATMSKQLNLSASELMGMLIHEIGHNFDSSVYAGVNILQLFAHGATEYLTNDYKTLRATTISNEEKRLNENPKQKRKQMKIQTLLDKISFKINQLLTPIDLLATPLYLLISPLCLRQVYNIKKSENFADSFAVAYGYGSDLSRALVKFGLAGFQNSKGISKTLKYHPIKKFFCDLTMTKRYMLAVLLEGTHGSVDSRMQVQIEMLKKDISSDAYPAEVKTILKDEVKKIEEHLDDYHKLVGTQDDNVKLHLTLLVRKLVFKMFKGRTDYISKVFPEFQLSRGIDFDDEKSTNH